MKAIRKIGVLTSGGDAPGMNACVRAVVRTALSRKMKISGIKCGYEGLIAGDFQKLGHKEVANIIHRGGTILKSARSDRFKTKDGMKAAHHCLMKEGIDALIVIGGDGTFRGALHFSAMFDFPVIGIPGTIDNDLYGTDNTIGYDTALNTVVDAVDKIRDTANSHNRLFFVEVMGRDAGFIALRSGIATGAEDILIPETETHIEELINKIINDRRRNKTSGIIMIAEGDELGGAIEVAERVKEKLPQFETRVTILGHIQRGGSPSCADRVLASTLGYEAVNALLEGFTGVMLGQINKTISYTPFDKATKHHADINRDMLEMARTLSL